MIAVNLLPLLERLAGEHDELLRRSLLTAIAAMAQCGIAGEALPTEVREAWAEKVLPTPACPQCSDATVLLRSKYQRTEDGMLASETARAAAHIWRFRLCKL